MKKLFLLTLTALFCLQIQAQLNTTLVSNLPYNQGVNDVWGWVDERDSTEYAIVALQRGVSIVSLANPAELAEADFVPGPSSGWRDMKTFGDHAYAINETDDGLLVMDLSALPDSVSYSYWSPQIEGLGELNTCHNLYIDEFGVAYLAGCNLNSGGMLFIDITTDPDNPIYIGKGDARYAHDVYVRDNMMFGSDVYAGFFSVTDVSDKSNPILMATQTTPFVFTHNAWLSDDSQVLFTTDEKPDAPVASYDISDLDNIKKLDEFRPAASINTGVIPHNAHVLNDFLAISHYSDGLVIVDAARPWNLVEVGNYDTFLGQGTGFSGAWGAYPFLPSGLILISDRSSGLFVVRPDYIRAAYLEGIVRDADSEELLSNVKIELSDQNFIPENTNLEGFYAVGSPVAATYEVTFSKLGYMPQTMEVNLQNGLLTTLDVDLEREEVYMLMGSVVLDENGIPIPDAQISVFNENISYATNTNANGTFTINDLIAGEYQVVVGAWGYRQQTVGYIADNNAELMFELGFGYEDDFALDLGWSVDAGASTGNWELGEPIGTGNTGNYINPEFDIDDDIGNQCYVTGNGGFDGGFDDVDDGTTVLISPLMDLTSYESPVLSYHRWFFNGGGNSPANDFLKVSISNGLDTVLLERYNFSASRWQISPEFGLKELIDITDKMEVFFETADQEGFGHLLEAGVDGFSVVEGGILDGVDDLIQIASFEVYPNPFSDIFQLEFGAYDFKTVDVKVYDTHARLVHQMNLQNGAAQTVNFPKELPNGIYWIRLEMDGTYQGIKRVLKQ